MPEKLKRKCPTCGIWFKAANYKRTLCPKCSDKVEQARAREKAQALARVQAIAKAPKSAPVPVAATLPAAPARVSQGAITSIFATLPDQERTPAPPSPPRLIRRPKLTVPYELTPEQITMIERRYQELATPTEFDGIRTQIAHEMNIPRMAVKRVVRAYRVRHYVPTCWELSLHPVESDALQAVRERYLPLLPQPPVGIHHILSEELGYAPSLVYHAIGRIRGELKLPRFAQRAKVEPQRHPDTSPAADPLPPAQA